MPSAVAYFTLTSRSRVRSRVTANASVAPGPSLTLASSTLKAASRSVTLKVSVDGEPTEYGSSTLARLTVTVREAGRAPSNGIATVAVAVAAPERKSRWSIGQAPVKALSNT